MSDYIIMMKTQTERTNMNPAEIRRERELLEAGATFAKTNWYRDPKDVNVLLWKSNDRSPMDDLMSQWLELGLIDLADFRATAKARKAQNDAFFAEYREARKNRTPEQIAEEAFELRAAFGPGETVVDVITGERTTV